MSYKHLSLEERHYIELEHKKGTSQMEIARILDVTRIIFPENLSYFSSHLNHYIQFLHSRTK